jgi:hypothetical protein
MPRACCEPSKAIYSIASVNIQRRCREYAVSPVRTWIRSAVAIYSITSVAFRKEAITCVCVCARARVCVCVCARETERERKRERERARARAKRGRARGECCNGRRRVVGLMVVIYLCVCVCVLVRGGENVHAVRKQTLPPCRTLDVDRLLARLSPLFQTGLQCCSNTMSCCNSQ